MIGLLILLAFAAGVQVVAFTRTGDVLYLLGAVCTALLCLVLAVLWAAREAGR